MCLTQNFDEIQYVAIYGSGRAVIMECLELLAAANGINCETENAVMACRLK